MFNETTLAVRGFAGSNGQTFENPGGAETFVFPVGVTPRRWDRQKEQYVDGATIWYDVRCYGQLAKNACLSIRKGTPVLVRGRLAQRTWTDKADNERLSLVIIAESVGIDLNTGRADFVKRNPNALDPVDGEPVDRTAHQAAEDAAEADEFERSGETSGMDSAQRLPDDAEGADALTSDYRPFGVLEDAEAAPALA